MVRITGAVLGLHVAVIGVCCEASCYGLCARCDVSFFGPVLSDGLA